MKISAMIYSYKGKNLRGVVDALLANTVSDIDVHVYDQHPLDRKVRFSDTKYTHIFWDSIKSPCEYKGEFLFNNKDDYALIISDDIIVGPGWDNKIISFIDNKNIIVSGMGNSKVVQKNNFYYGIESQYSDSFLLSNFIDRNFIFGYKTLWEKFMYPYDLKYNGEDLALSLNIFRQNIDIYSVPSDTYHDLMVRTIESIYTPFSRDHNYNKLINELKTDDSNEHNKFYRTSSQFLDFHGIARSSLNQLPYENNDVLYEPTNLEFQDIDHRKFIQGVNRIS